MSRKHLITFSIFILSLSFLSCTWITSFSDRLASIGPFYPVFARNHPGFYSWIVGIPLFYYAGIFAGWYVAYTVSRKSKIFLVLLLLSLTAISAVFYFVFNNYWNSIKGTHFTLHSGFQQYRRAAIYAAVFGQAFTALVGTSIEALYSAIHLCVRRHKNNPEKKSVFHDTLVLGKDK